MGDGSRVSPQSKGSSGPPRNPDELRAQTRGKGSHGTLFFGTARTIVPDRKRELKTGTLRAMLRQIRLAPKDLE